MKKIAYAAFASAAALALAACGSSDKASEEAQAENVEMPAEEAMNTADAMATPAGRCFRRCLGSGFRQRQRRGRGRDGGCRKEDVIP